MKQRGSAFVYIVIVIASITGFILTATLFGFQARKVTTLRELDARATETFNSLLAKIDADKARGQLTLPATLSFDLNGAKCTATVTDNSSEIAGSAVVNASVTVRDQIYRLSTRIAAPEPSIFSYAIATDGALSTTSLVSTGLLGSDGSLYATGAVSLTNVLNLVTGDVLSASTIGPVGLNVLGLKRENIPSKAFPTLDRSAYSTAATVTRAGGNMNGYAFSAVTSSSPYPLLYVDGDLTLRGTLSGVGTIYVSGNLSYGGNTGYSGGSRVVIIVEGNMTLGSNDVVGIHFVSGTTTISGTSGKKIEPGNIVSKSLTISRDLTVVNDLSVVNDPNEAIRHRLPGYWP